MPLFDIIETSGKAYIKAWDERAYLLKLAIMPLLAKIFFFGVVVLLDYQTNIFRLTLVLLPSYFLEGWMVAHITRLVFLGERWPVKLSGKTERDILFLADRGRAIFSAIIMYVLIMMAFNAFKAVNLIDSDELQEVSQSPDPSFWFSFVAVCMLFVIILAFKYLFIYMPLAIDIPVRTFLRKFSGIQPSLYLMAMALIGCVPALFVGQFCQQLLIALFASNYSFLALVVFVWGFITELAAIVMVNICFAMVLKQVFQQDGPQGSGR